MATNRLLPYQFGDGNTVDATRIETAFEKLVELYNDVPADLIRRRWTPSEMIWGINPFDLNEVGSYTGNPYFIPFLRSYNTVNWQDTVQPVESYQNPQRVKSARFDGVLNPPNSDLLTWEVSFAPSRPVIIGYLAVFAEYQATGPYTNDWDLFTGGKGFTLQVTVDDAWDVENRKKLRQESLIYNTESGAFRFNPSDIKPTDTMQPPSPLAAATDRAFNGFAVVADPIVLIPAKARVRFQWTIPLSVVPNSWGEYPNQGNLWSLCAQVWEATR